MKIVFFITILTLLFSSCSSTEKVSKKPEKTQLTQKKVEKKKTLDELKKEEEDRIKAEEEAKKKAEKEKLEAIKKAEEEAKKDAESKKAKELAAKKAMESISEDDKKEINSILSKIESASKKKKMLIIEKALKKHPKSEILFYYKALTYYEENNTEKAIEAAKISLKLNPKYHMAVELLFNIYLKDNAQKASLFINSKIKMFPNDYKLLIVGAKALFELKNYDEVIRLSKEIFKLNQNNKMAFQLLASGYYFKGLNELAYYVILKAEDAMLSLPRLYYIKGLIFYKDKKYKSARDAFSEAFSEKPDFFEAGTRLAYSEYRAGVNLIDPKLKKEKFLEAKKVYEKVLKLRETELTLLNYGLVLYELDKNKKALEVLEKAKKLNSSNYRIIYDMGIIYLMKPVENDIERYKKAISLFQEYNRLLPKNKFKTENANSLITEAQIAKSVAEAKIDAIKQQEIDKQKEIEDAKKKEELEKQKAIEDAKKKEELEKQKAIDDKADDDKADDDKADDDKADDDKADDDKADDDKADDDDK